MPKPNQVSKMVHIGLHTIVAFKPQSTSTLCAHGRVPYSALYTPPINHNFLMQRAEICFAVHIVQLGGWKV